MPRAAPDAPLPLLLLSFVPAPCIHTPETIIVSCLQLPTKVCLPKLGLTTQGADTVFTITQARSLPLLLKHSVIITLSIQRQYDHLKGQATITCIVKAQATQLIVEMATEFHQWQSGELV